MAFDRRLEKTWASPCGLPTTVGRSPTSMAAFVSVMSCSRFSCTSTSVSFRSTTSKRRSAWPIRAKVSSDSMRARMRSAAPATRSR